MLFSLVGCANGETKTSDPAAPSTNSGTSTSPNPSTPASPDVPAGPERSKTVNIGETQRVRGLDPHQAQDTGTMAGINYMYEALLTTERTYEGEGLGSANEVGLLAER